jgi:hypothetical protein
MGGGLNVTASFVYLQFQTLAYPNVKNPMTFLYIWVLQFCGDVANLIFLTHPYALAHIYNTRACHLP